MQDWQKDICDELIIKAIEIAVTQNKRNIAYINGILKRFKDNNIKNKADYEAYESLRNKKSANTQLYNKKPNRRSFNDFEQRTYDYDDLEEKLLASNDINTESNDTSDVLKSLQDRKK